MSNLSLLDSLPEILASLDADALETRAHGALDLARLVDATYDADAAMVAEYLRESGAVELIAELLSDPEPYVHQKILMIVCNLSSDAYDSRSHDTKALLRENEVIARLRPHLLAPPEDWVSQLYAAAAMQNLCKDIELAREAKRLGVTSVLDKLVRTGVVSRATALPPAAALRGRVSVHVTGAAQHEQLVQYCAGALSNVTDALAIAQHQATPKSRSVLGRLGTRMSGRSPQDGADRPKKKPTVKLSAETEQAIARRLEAETEHQQRDAWAATVLQQFARRLVARKERNRRLGGALGGGERARAVYWRSSVLVWQRERRQFASRRCAAVGGRAATRHPSSMRRRTDQQSSALIMWLRRERRRKCGRRKKRGLRRRRRLRQRQRKRRR